MLHGNGMQDDLLFTGNTMDRLVFPVVLQGKWAQLWFTLDVNMPSLTPWQTPDFSRNDRRILLRETGDLRDLLTRPRKPV